jgi:FAD synthetase
VQTFSESFTYVLTSGGIGPTHDDLTFEAVAAAFNEDLVVHEDIVRPLKRFFKSDRLNDGMLKLATVPRSAKLNLAPGTSASDLQYPLVSVQVRRMQEQGPILQCPHLQLQRCSKQEYF